MDHNGRYFGTFTTFPINISNLKHGIYVIVILDNNNDIYLFKFLKNK